MSTTSLSRTVVVQVMTQQLQGSHILFSMISLLRDTFYSKTKLNYVVDDAVRSPQVEFLAMDEPTNTYVSTISINKFQI